MPDEIAAVPGVGHVADMNGRPAFHLEGGPMVRADMGALGRSLRAVAAEAGVEMVDRVTTIAPEVDGDGRVRARYPERVDLDALGRWDARVERLLGALPA